MTQATVTMSFATFTTISFNGIAPDFAPKWARSGVILKVSFGNSYKRRAEYTLFMYAEHSVYDLIGEFYGEKEEI